MKILIVHDIGNIQGGAEIYLSDLKKELKKRGHIVKFLTSKSYLEKNTLSDYEFNAFDNLKIGKLLFYFFNPFSYFKVKKVIKDFKPDIIHFNTVTKASPSVFLATRNVPLVMTVHDFGIVYPKLKIKYPHLDVCKYSGGACCIKHAGLRFYFEKLRIKLMAKQIKKVDALFTNSKFMSKVLKKCEIYPITSLNYIGIKLLNPQPLLNTKKILYVGRLEVEKGPEYLVRSMPGIIKKYPLVQLNMIGSGKEEENLKKIINDLNIKNNVNLIPFIERKDLWEFYKESSLLVIPSLWPEPFGIVGIEAMSVGRPVIATDFGGIKEWLEDGKNGFLVSSKNPRLLERKITNYLDNFKKYKFFEKNAVTKSKNFDIKIHVNLLEAKYQKIVDGYNI